MLRNAMLVGLVALPVLGCTQMQSGSQPAAQPGPPNDFVFLGESNVTGEEAAQEANLIVRNANAAGCSGVSVGGYATTLIDEELSPRIQWVYGVPVMVSCPAGVVLLPNGAAQP